MWESRVVQTIQDNLGNGGLPVPIIPCFVNECAGKAIQSTKISVTLLVDSQRDWAVIPQRYERRHTICHQRITNDHLHWLV
ncbi:hypothetical protein A8V01_15675 [Novosphingobium guangzhouense]|uniref:Uncharacterized protein n=1 Tax=Novosphingobium guangzhouense TaxID=1850347 RepID=A0A2K2G3M7_9SPHN|nr:hypothetical protein A8V01_15675 [Novosphingobium guangzhouense]